MWLQRVFSGMQIKLNRHSKAPATEQSAAFPRARQTDSDRAQAYRERLLALDRRLAQIRQDG